MRKFLATLIVIPLGLVFIVFAVANRHFVTLSLDPFNSTDPALSLRLPLFVLIIAVAVMGVLAGSCATWFRQRHWRRAARQREAEARAAKAQLADLHANTVGSRNDPQRLSGPSQGAFYTASGRDKQGATL